MQILANIPSPPQGVWHLGPFPLRAYALCIIVGILVAMWMTQRRYVARGGNSDVVWDAAIVIIPAGIVGGRLYHVITDHQKYFCADCNPADALKITNGGLGIWGAVALGVFAIWVMFKIKKVPMAPFADAVAPGLILAQAIGRLGNWFNQELYGRPTDVPWALDIYYRINEAGEYAPVSGRSTGEVITSVHPTFLYELVWNVAVCLFLLWAQKAWKLGYGRVFALYVAGYTLGRFFVENMRSDEATMVFGLRINVIVSVVLFIVALVVFFKLPRGQETPAEVDPARNGPKALGESQESH
ncbi:prolipoprotein diacylglyceryl transferase [Corynebacterium sp. HMSC06D04]|mgnify:FL=1|uniref:Phosphatidylglycerol--prolipoprotein diacylglyceryl transferase n=1 Tax=Corynebacterium simulans TaxID=146827 RepID=A0ABR5V8T6_9CORY|nr:MULTISPECIES: prolipoprotein diacylglyceryl transferase [Corynebacterium]AMO92589.1 prolipoprotein diacylglyceryl transferase [Corynebacterium simulans]KXU17998.1 prolipoprotein diacylglyceryl transferase [Corynebacterium simulans]MDK7138210.1 prolipoprotein diacylglyceryl transferase [Corynebacterium simulans]OFM02983.1 prolipoprotein diacylglyceryl transferase [Corynebacterium sp. HMSC071F07]OFQ49265.1 prolipoprotein diacylglyceryl transferase [Corynebacterium sp. HMSC076D02]